MKKRSLKTHILACAASAAIVLATGCGHNVGARASAKPTQIVVLGRSTQHRLIEARPLGAPASGMPAVLVIGCIHGDEPAGISVVQRVRTLSPPARVALWTVADLNPDGVFAHTRQNANGVDLNRNFPFGWRPIGVRGDQQFSGAHQLSEPESRFAYELILRLRPRVTLWFHQPLGLVDESGGNRALERRFAQLSGLPLERLPRYPGSAASWQNQSLPGTTASVVELPPGRPSARDVTRWAAAIEGLAGSVPHAG
jgi:protein MpaA